MAATSFNLLPLAACDEVTTGSQHTPGKATISSEPSGTGLAHVFLNSGINEPGDIVAVFLEHHLGTVSVKPRILHAQN